MTYDGNDNPDLDLIRSSDLFDSDWYVEKYPDVETSDLEPVIHYYKIGAPSHRSPGPNFDADYYLEQNPDVASAGVNPLVHFIRFGKAEGRSPIKISEYNQDGLRTIHNSEFMSDDRFVAAYQRGIQAAGGQDYHWHWRVHIGLWAARSASKLQGDFVECGVNAGFLSSAIMYDLDWNSQDRRFYLLDTFNGISLKHTLEAERKEGIAEKNQEMIDRNFYVTNSETVRKNFEEWPSARIIEGMVPETLHQIDTEQVAFTHLDMNCAPPEIAALEYLWPKMVPGALVLLDDYGYFGYHNQKYAFDDLAKQRDFDVAALPTGQGLIVKR